MARTQRPTGRTEAPAYSCAMTRRRGVTGPPKAYLDGGQPWPSIQTAPGIPSSVARAVSVASAVSVALAEALDDRSVAEVARTADVARSTIYDLLNGSTWPDLVTVSKLEDALKTPLWPTAFPCSCGQWIGTTSTRSACRSC